MGWSPFGRISNWKSRIASRYKSVYERDKRWIMQFNVVTLEKFAWPLLVGFVCLNFLDVYSTTIAMTKVGLFHEQNPIASMLFSHRFQGFLVAIAFKYMPLIPLFFIVFVKDASGRHEVQIKLLKFTAIVSLTGADALLIYVVGIHNLQSLLGLV